MESVPHRQILMEAVIKALHVLGGSASVEELWQAVVEQLELPDSVINIPHKTTTGKPDGRTELQYNLAWSRTYLKQLGYIRNSERGVWSLTGKSFKETDFSKGAQAAAADVDGNENWRFQLQKLLTEKITPAAFERLIQRVLRESGFTQVEVTGRTNDGGIDGKGVAKINGMLSFHVVFQCKRYKGAVSASKIRDFRGAMSGRTDKGLFITTGYFTREAIREAVREGAPAIDLVDGEKLLDKLKTLGLGVRVEAVESVILDEGWFTSI
jgi:restriction system protein